MAVAVCQRFDAQTAFEAMTSACSLITVGGYSHAVHGALVRNTWAAVGTVNGMRAADWARMGIGGMADGPYSVFTELLGQQPSPLALTNGLGQEWAVANGYHKTVLAFMLQKVRPDLHSLHLPPVCHQPS